MKMESMFAATVTVYCIQFLIIVFYHIFLYIGAQPHLNKKYYIAYVVSFWTVCIVNVTYTGMMGWNLHPASELERFLDNVSTALLVTLTVFYLFKQMGYKKREAMKDEDSTGREMNE